MIYKSTRSNSVSATASQAILQGLSEDGGLFVPVSFPKLDRTFEELSSMTYQETAYEVMKLFLDDFSEEELKDCIAGAYDSKFDTAEIAPLRKVRTARQDDCASADTFYLELFHGATIAFKDMALSILPHLMMKAAGKKGGNREIVILTATSGDTGKAALAGFANVKGTRIIVFYPKDGVSSIQERQMVTQKGDNTCVIGIRGNFDDAQTGVKQIFTDVEVRDKLDRAGMRFSSANSINIGRLVPQIVYYVYSYARLVRDGAVKAGEKINFVVPTGNFGNILAAYYAKQIGLPVNRLICASNSNKVLFDFFETGDYNRNRDFILTSSPSMDILVSSNLERLIYHISAETDEERTKACAAYMNQLSSTGEYAITDAMRAKLTDFYGGFATEEETAGEIRRLYEAEGYVIDPHTAVASCVYGKYRAKTGDTTPTVIVSTASPFKFESSVMKALGHASELPDLELAQELSRIAGVPVPEAVESLRGAQIMHHTVCAKEDMLAEAERFLGI